MMASSPSMEPPSKRQKLSPTSAQNILTSTPSDSFIERTVDHPMESLKEPTPVGREAAVGILHLINPHTPGFSGVFKQRYTDFLVNEILQDGTVLHLMDDRAPQNKGKKIAAQVSERPSQPHPVAVAKINPSDFVISDSDNQLLTELLGSEVKDRVIDLHDRILSKQDAKPVAFEPVISEKITDRALRSQIHHNIRRIFGSRVDSEATKDSTIKFGATTISHRRQAENPELQRQTSIQSQPKGKLGWQELGGEFLHFSLYKENKNTDEVIGFISRELHCKSKDFGQAGTKDRRGVTVQRVSVYRKYAAEVARANNKLYNARVGDFKYEKHRLELGDLNGNQFTVTLRDCHFGSDASLDSQAKIQLAKSVVDQAVEDLKNYGFLNYFGLQRFGTFGIGNEEVGKMILNANFQAAVEAILAYKEKSIEAESDVTTERNFGRDDIARAKALNIFKLTGSAKNALEKLPRKFSAEQSILRHLSSRSTDFIGALLSVNRNLRTIYVHGYQSYVWNVVASERWKRYGNKVVAGDLVLVNEHVKKFAAPLQEDEFDEDGEKIIRPSSDDVAVTHDDIYQRARYLTADEVADGSFTIFDIVLPTPGYDILYPDNDIGDFYKEFMGSAQGGNLDPADMRRSYKDFSLSGSYRKLIGTSGKDLDITYETKLYYEEDEQFVETDFEKIKNSRATGKNDQGRGGRAGRAGRPGRDIKEHNAQQQALPGVAKWNTFAENVGIEEQAARMQLAAEQLANPLKAEDVPDATIKEHFAQTIIDADGSRQIVEAKAQVKEPGEDDTTKLPPLGHSTVTSAATPLPRSLVRPSSLHSLDSQDGGVSLLQPSPELLLSQTLKREHEAITKAEELPVASENAAADPGMEPPQISQQVNADSVSEMETIDSSPPKYPDNNQDQEGRARIAVILKFKLGPGQFATMALRECLKLGGVTQFQTEFTAAK